MPKRLFAFVTASATALAAVPSVSTAAPPAPASWSRCAVCHDATKGGPNKIGPNLYGVIGKKAGAHAPTFKYSDGLKKSGLVWNAATLDKWIENPRALVPGTMMAFPGIKDPAKRAEIVGYLKSLK